MSYRFLQTIPIRTFGKISNLIYVYPGLLLLNLQAFTPLYGQSRMVWKNRITDQVVEINTKRKIKFRLVGTKGLSKGKIESAGNDWLLISGEQIPLHQILEIRSWAVKKPIITTVPAASLATLGALMTIVGAGEWVAGSNEEPNGYRDINKVLAISGPVYTYWGWRWLKRKRINPREWELLSWE